MDYMWSEIIRSFFLCILMIYGETATVKCSKYLEIWFLFRLLAIIVKIKIIKCSKHFIIMSLDYIKRDEKSQYSICFFFLMHLSHKPSTTSGVIDLIFRKQKDNLMIQFIKRQWFDIRVDCGIQLQPMWTI